MQPTSWAKADKREPIRLDPQLASFVEATAHASGLELDNLAWQQTLSIVRPAMPTSGQPAGSIDRVISTQSGGELRLRFYYPPQTSAELPMVMHLHGGGFVGGTIEMDDARCLAIAQQTNCLVASVDYPLAPEHPFPAAIEAAFCAWQWLCRTGKELGGDPNRMAVSGSSAGGHIAIGVCLLARAQGFKAPLMQLLTYPVIDPGLDSNSYGSFADGPFLTRARMAWYWKQYRGTARPSGQLYAPLSGPLDDLPPTFVITAEYDVLRDEAESYAVELAKAGAEAEVRCYPGMIHGFLSVVPDHPASVQAIAECSQALRTALWNQRELLA